MLDAITVTSSRSNTGGRQPRALVRIGSYPGTVISGWKSWSVVNNSYYEADAYRVSFAASALPAAMNANWFSTQKEIFIEILAGFPADPANPQVAELDSLIYGRADEICYDPRDGVISLTGRDLTAAFIDLKLSEQYNNQTASAVATQLAQAHGLTPVVTPTYTNIGTYYTRDQVHLTADRSEWDLLAFLAREEGFICFVSGQSLYFEPDPRNTANPFVVNWQTNNGTPSANVKGLQFFRILTVAKGITVQVRSASLTRKTAVVQSYPTSSRSITAGRASPFGAVQQYFFTLAPGKTPAQVQAYAQQKYNDLISHEMKLSMYLPGNESIDISTPIQVQGTGTAFDQIYFPLLIERRMDMDEGYTMQVEAQNNSPDLST